MEPRLTLTATRSAKPTSTEDVSVIESLLAHGAKLDAQDAKGNTCLHYATAWGNLKAVRALIQAGAVPVSTNRAGWQPDSYSLTVQAEVYYKNLVSDWEKRVDVEELQRDIERRAQARSVRLVQGDESDDFESEPSRSRAGSAFSQGTASTDAGLGISNAWK